MDINDPNSKFLKQKLICVVLRQAEKPLFNFISFTFGSNLGICSPRVHIFFFFSMWLCEDWRKLWHWQSLSNSIFLAALAKQKHHHTLFFIRADKVSFPCWICYPCRATGYSVWAALWRFLSHRWLLTCYCLYFRSLPHFPRLHFIALGLIINN